MSQFVPSFSATKAPENCRIAIVDTAWNAHITGQLRQGAVEALEAAGVKAEDIDTYQVPGAVELTFAASQLIETSSYDAIIVFGCVIRGETPHFDYVCQSVTQGVTALNADCDTPVIFGLLTVNNEQQALDRIGGKTGHKGIEAAMTALDMVKFVRSIE